MSDDFSADVVSFARFAETIRCSAFPLALRVPFAMARAGGGPHPVRVPGPVAGNGAQARNHRALGRTSSRDPALQRLTLILANYFFLFVGLSICNCGITVLLEKFVNARTKWGLNPSNARGCRLTGHRTSVVALTPGTNSHPPSTSEQPRRIILRDLDTSLFIKSTLLDRGAVLR